ncbi:MAG TPA: dihydroorotate dehydrogenase electron transfer subunit [bacterium]|nr:dihydroorotate dehydrogenase electron transfer subunit [bacterium]
MSKIYLEQALVYSNDEIAQDIFELRLETPAIASEHKPGQFINIQTNPGGLPLWRRPFSIARISGDIIDIIYKVIGTGTQQMAALRPGDAADIIGPLGNSFSVEIKSGTIPLLIGGGLGFAPLIILRDYFVHREITPVLFMGAVTKAEHYYLDDPQAELMLTTDDGTLGHQGLVTDSLQRYFEDAAGHQRFAAYSCGPEPMLAKVASVCRTHGIPLELSIEREMACGVGLCQGCAIEQLPPQKKYALVCKDGPIFNAEVLAFTDHTGSSND